LQNTTLIGNATSYLAVIDSWTPPEGITVHQIAGVGEDTLSGITYSSGEGCISAVSITLPLVGPRLICLERGEKLLYTPNLVLDGDGTVVTPSALAMSDTTQNVKRWWVDLYGLNLISIPGTSKKFSLPDPLRKKHKDLFELPQVQTLLSDILTEAISTPPPYVSSDTPDLGNDHRLRFVLHSPLILSAIGNDGTEYPAVRYGEVQILTLPSNTNPTLSLQGTADGSFTLEIQELEGDTIVALATFSGIPNTALTTAILAFPDGTLANASDLELDYDGNGTIDLTLTPEEGEIITLPEPSLTDLLAILKETISTFGLSKKLKKDLLKKVVKLEKKIEKKNKKNQKILDKLEKNINKKTIKGKIDTADAGEILALLEALEAQASIISLDSELLTELKDKILALDLKQEQKQSLLKRIERLQNTARLTKSLERFSAIIMKKGEKEKIDDASVQELLTLLEAIEQVI